MECSCGTWELEGTAAAVLSGARLHLIDHPSAETTDASFVITVEQLSKS